MTWRDNIRYTLAAFVVMMAHSALGVNHVKLEHAERLTFDQDKLPDAQVLMDNVRFSHDGAIMTCDSAHFYQGDDSFDAFGHIRMNQGDTIRVSGEILHYDGITRHARLKGNVVMINRNTTLKTDSLDYDRNADVGYYDTGGTLFDETNTLTSMWGEYSPRTKTAKFKNNVRLVGKTAAMQTNNLDYNTATKIAEVHGKSIIVHDDGATVVYTEEGWYDTKNERGEITRSNKIDRKDGKHIRGNVIRYDSRTGESWALKDALLWDDENKSSLGGSYVYYYDGTAGENDSVNAAKKATRLAPVGPAKGHGQGDYAEAYFRAVVKEYSGTDTLYLSADTIRMIQNEVDTAQRTGWAIGDVRLFRADVQGKCDSIIYHTQDSIAKMMGSPVVWSDSMQITGEWMEAQMGENKKIKELRVLGWAAGMMDDAYGKFNQVEGKKLTGYVKDNKLDYAIVDGNAESIYWAREEDGTMIGMNRGASSKLYVHIKDGQMERLVMTPNGSGTLYPEDQVPEDEDMLKHYSWKADLRPRKPEDIKPGDVMAEMEVKTSLDPEEKPVKTVAKKKRNGKGKKK
ncbi:MAG: hypothetical protein ILP23_03160 [Paludibacteraceae bacterium]|nr:hypothetical protein [Paludibacteraceae bacterium]